MNQAGGRRTVEVIGAPHSHRSGHSASPASEPTPPTDPDGAATVYVCNVATQNGETGALVFRLDGTVLHTLGRGTFPYDFSPDGRSLLFSFLSEGGTDLALLDLETGTRQALRADDAGEARRCGVADPRRTLAPRGLNGAEGRAPFPPAPPAPSTPPHSA